MHWRWHSATLSWRYINWSRSIVPKRRPQPIQMPLIEIPISRFPKLQIPQPLYQPVADTSLILQKNSIEHNRNSHTGFWYELDPLIFENFLKIRSTSWVHPNCESSTQGNSHTVSCSVLIPLIFYESFNIHRDHPKCEPSPREKGHTGICSVLKSLIFKSLPEFV